MPGPGGHGGGGHHGGGGGFHGGGGGFHGGHPGGGFHGGFRPHPMGGWHRRPFYGGGGGCLGGLFGLILTPIIFVIIIVAIFASVFQFNRAPDVIISENTYYVNGDDYDEELFQDYADAQYQHVFSNPEDYEGNAEDYEGNLLLLFVTYDDHTSYDYIAWVGFNVDAKLQEALGTDSNFGTIVENQINTTNYKYSLSGDLSNIMMDLCDLAKSLGVESTGMEEPLYALVNNSDLSLSAGTVEGAIRTFADLTGIPTAICVADASDVYHMESSGSNSSVSGQPEKPSATAHNNWSTILLVAAIVVIVIVLIVVIVKKRKRDDDDFISQERKRDDRYKDNY